MFALKTCSTTRHRSIALVLLGSSFAIQMVPPVLHGWSRVTGVSDDMVMAAIVAVYLCLLGIVMLKGRSGKS
ncbi:MAG: hypothetical protein H7176_01335 [Bdellovibrionales bacterium]|nr:hypothetical protein [Massilia sp.]